MPSKTSYVPFYVNNGTLINAPTVDAGEPSIELSYRLIETGGTVTHSGPLPSYKQLIANHQNATTSLSGEKTSIKVEDGHYAVSYQDPNSIPKLYYWTITKGDLTFSSVPSPATIDLTLATNLAKMGFVKKCIEKQQAFESQIFLGELRETLHMIRNPAQALRKGLDDYFRRLKRRRKGSNRHKLRALSGTWLEWSFGVKPLVSDIESGLEALRRFADRPSRFQGVSFRAGQEIVLSEFVLPIGVGGFSYNIIGRHKTKAEVKFYGAVEIQTSGLAFGKQNLGLTLNNFVPTLWEVCPWSFLADYFTNIGDLLTSWSFGRTGIAWSASGSLQEVLIESSSGAPYLNGPPGPGNYNWTNVKPSKSVGSRRTVGRSAYFGSFVPDFRLEMPEMLDQKWINISALAAQRASFRPRY